MNKIKAWFKSVFTLEDNYEDMRSQMALILEVGEIITNSEGKPANLRSLYELLRQITLIDFVWAEELLTPLELACQKANPWCLAALIANGADVNGKERNKARVSFRPLHVACKVVNHPWTLDCVGMLIEKGADFNACDEAGNRPIHYATVVGSLEVVGHLLKVGAHVDPVGTINQATPLSLTSVMKSVEEIQQLRADNNQDQDNSQNPPHNPSAQPLPQAQPTSRAEVAVGGMNPIPEEKYIREATVHQLMRLLLKYGADVNKVVLSGDALTLAAICLHVDRMFILLANGADVNNPQCPERYSILKEVLELVPENRLKKTDSFFNTLLLLLAAGARITLESLENVIRPVLDSRSELTSVKQDAYELLQFYAAAPMSLKMLCRLRVRAHLPKDVDASIKSLPLANVLHRYLRFEDVVPREYEDE